MSSRNTKSSLTILFVLLFLIPSLKAQLALDPTVQKSITAIKSLKDGTLIVRLPSKTKKIEALKKILSDKTIDAGDKRRTKKLLDNTIRERDNYRKEIMEAFAEHYSFSNYLFINDTSSVSLKKGVKQGIFLHKELYVDAELKLETPDYFLLRNGTTDPSKSAGIEAFIVANSQNEDLEKPFPYYVKRNDFATMLSKLFSPKKSMSISANKSITKLNSNLQKFYSRVVGGLN